MRQAHTKSEYMELDDVPVLRHVIRDATRSLWVPA